MILLDRFGLTCRDMPIGKRGQIMKGKITYMAIIEKEIEIPDEVIEISEKSWHDWTEEEDKKMKVFSENVWDSIDNVFYRINICYEKNGKNYIIEDY